MIEIQIARGWFGWVLSPNRLEVASLGRLPRKTDNHWLVEFGPYKKEGDALLHAVAAASMIYGRRIAAHMAISQLQRMVIKVAPYGGRNLTEI